MPNYTWMRNAWSHSSSSQALYPEEPGHGTYGAGEQQQAELQQAMHAMEQQQEQQAMDHSSSSQALDDMEQQQQQPGLGPYGADSVTRMNRPGIA